MLLCLYIHMMANVFKKKQGIQVYMPLSIQLWFLNLCASGSELKIERSVSALALMQLSRFSAQLSSRSCPDKNSIRGDVLKRLELHTEIKSFIPRGKNLLISVDLDSFDVKLASCFGVASTTSQVKLNPSQCIEDTQETTCQCVYMT